jgi:hypothetical protein
LAAASGPPDASSAYSPECLEGDFFELRPKDIA